MENVSIGRAWNSIQIEFISVDNCGNPLCGYDFNRNVRRREIKMCRNLFQISILWHIFTL